MFLSACGVFFPFICILNYKGKDAATEEDEADEAAEAAEAAEADVEDEDEDPEKEEENKYSSDLYLVPESDRRPQVHGRNNSSSSSSTALGVTRNSFSTFESNWNQAESDMDEFDTVSTGSNMSNLRNLSLSSSLPSSPLLQYPESKVSLCCIKSKDAWFNLAKEGHFKTSAVERESVLEDILFPENMLVEDLSKRPTNSYSRSKVMKAFGIDELDLCVYPQDPRSKVRRRQQPENRCNVRVGKQVRAIPTNCLRQS